MSTTNTGSIPSGLFKLSDITNAVRSGARSNLFEVEISTFDPSQTAQGASTELQLLFKYMCKGGQLPGSTLGLIEVPFMAGRRYKIAGDRTFAEWTSTIISDVNQKIREALEELQELYSSTNFNSDVARKLVGSQPTDFLLLDIKQYDLGGIVTYHYKLHNCWPTDISTIDLSYDNTDSLEEFTVTWAYDYFTIEQQGVNVSGDDKKSS